MEFIRLFSLKSNQVIGGGGTVVTVDFLILRVGILHRNLNMADLDVDGLLQESIQDQMGFSLHFSFSTY